jgi:RimJ/RimL family protein N-acetyltransferase
MSLLAVRCAGGAELGAGHVARCLQIALAFRAGGDDVLFAGEYDGLAADLLSAAAVETTRELPDHLDAVVVDSYEVPRAEVEALARRTPVGLVSDGGERPAGVIVLDYHPDALDAELAGPAYAPVSPRCAAARRKRGFERALVTVGAGESGRALRDAAAVALRRHGLELLEPAGTPGLQEQLATADVAVSAAGVTAYELACAGVPSALVPIARNQVRVARAFAARGLALAGEDLGALVNRLTGGPARALLAAAGPVAVDGYGAFRTRDAFRAAFAGLPPPCILRYRPATADDAERQLAWRNDPAVREASWDTEEVDIADHAPWFADLLDDPLRTLLVIEHEDGPVGSVRFDVEGDEAEISVMVARERRGAGTGSKAIRESSELFLATHPHIERVRAALREDNARSANAFRRAGYVAAAGCGGEGRLVLILDRAALASGSR